MKKSNWKISFLKAFSTKDSVDILEALDSMEEELDKEEEVVDTKDEGEDDVMKRLEALELLVKSLIEANAKEEATEVTDEEEMDKEEEELVEDEEELVEEEDKEEDKVTTDSFKDVCSKAAILSPSLKIKPVTKDSVFTEELMIKYKKQILKKALSLDSTKKVVLDNLKGLTIDSLKDKELLEVFEKSVSFMKAKNNKNITSLRTTDSVVKEVNLNTKYNDFWSKLNK